MKTQDEIDNVLTVQTTTLKQNLQKNQIVMHKQIKACTLGHNECVSVCRCNWNEFDFDSFAVRENKNVYRPFKFTHQYRTVFCVYVDFLPFYSINSKRVRNDTLAYGRIHGKSATRMENVNDNVKRMRCINM